MEKSIAISLSSAARVLRLVSFVFVCTSVSSFASTNTPPTIAFITNQTVYVDHPALFMLGVGDLETSTNNLHLSLVSSNPTLLTPEDIVFHFYSADGHWYLTLVPTFGLTGTATNTVTVSDGTNTANRSFVLTVTPPPTNAVRFFNPAPITIPDSGTATPYPSAINVSGMIGTITNVHLTISKFSHKFPDDVHMLLVGPTGRAVVIWSHCGGGAAVTNTTVTLTDSGVAPIPDDFEIWSEQLKPADFAANNPPANNTNDFPFPAPGAPYTNAVALSSFNGLTANGTWSLYVYDDFPPDNGSIAGGWSLMVTTTGGEVLADITAITRQGTNIRIAWTTTRGHTNFVQAVNGNPGYRTNFVDLSGPIFLAGTGSVSTNYVDVGGINKASARFYRVRLVP